MTETIHTDILIIGSGIAGLSLALHVSKLGSVTIITKKDSSLSNTNRAQGGIAVVVDSNDTFQSHIDDTLDAGVGLCNVEAVQTMVTEGPARLKELIETGVEFTKKNGLLDLGREGGHTKNRVVHANDITGKIIESALLDAVSKHPNIQILEHYAAIELITEHHLSLKTESKSCYGIYAIDSRRNVFIKIMSKFTVLSTGGAGQIYLHTTNPSIATGDGVAMAYRAGAIIENMEFVQFHPTTLFHPKAQSFLITEAIRGFGGILRLKNGEEFMDKYDKRKSLAPRDIIARAIDAELKKNADDFVYVDVTHLKAKNIIEHFPNIYQHCLQFGIDITKEPIPVVPAAHYFCGGVKTNLYAETTIDRLYACGEVACTGVHGANRLASNSLLEAIVFSYRTFLSIQKNFNNQFKTYDFKDWDDSGTENQEEWILISHNFKEMQQVMNDYVGIVRSNLRLERAKRRIDFLKEETERYYRKTKITPSLLELRNAIKVASLVIDSAMMRKESRGLHFNTDYTNKDDEKFLHNTAIFSH